MCEIYNLVSQVPKGKVVTYGQLAELSGCRSPRAVGHVLHRNPDPVRVPCHRVVLSSGRLASGYAYGGPNRQQEILESEEIIFSGEKIDLKKYQWKPHYSEE